MLYYNNTNREKHKSSLLFDRYSSTKLFSEFISWNFNFLSSSFLLIWCEKEDVECWVLFHVKAGLIFVTKTKIRYHRWKQIFIQVHVLPIQHPRVVDREIEFLTCKEQRKGNQTTTTTITQAERDTKEERGNRPVRKSQKVYHYLIQHLGWWT